MVTVYTNDLRRSVFGLTITGMIENFAHISNQRVLLTGKPGDALSERVTIRPSKLRPFKITGFRLDKNEQLDVALHESDKACCLEYTLDIVNLRKEAGRYLDTIRLETDCDINPEIPIVVIINLLEEKNQGHLSPRSNRSMRGIVRM